MSKALAALVDAVLLARAFERLGLKRDSGYSLVMWATIWGFVGAKIYYLLEQLPSFDVHHQGGMGFTWYGGLLGGAVAALVVVRRHELPLGVVAGAAAVPPTIAYGIGRLGCLLAGDGIYGRPTSVPWAMTFPNKVVPTDVPVHPTSLYVALAAVLIAGALWAIGKRWNPPAVFGAYLVLSGISRFFVVFLCINELAVLGLTQPQLWALAGLVVGVALIVRTRFLKRRRTEETEASASGESLSVGSFARPR